MEPHITSIQPFLCDVFFNRGSKNMSLLQGYENSLFFRLVSFSQICGEHFKP
jgi:hypothetical protein